MARGQTNFRQGDLLRLEDARALSLVREGQTDRCVLISHDCDLQCDDEAFVEIIVGAVAVANAMFKNSRHPRRLHLDYVRQTEGSLCIELMHANKVRVERQRFLQLAGADAEFTLPADERRALRQWLAARYGRPAFPDAFEARLRKAVRKRETVETQIREILKPKSSYLVGLFFDLGQERFVEVSAGEPYFLSISVVYDATSGGTVAREMAERTATELTELFVRVFGPPEAATEIVLENCSAVADTYMTLADLRRVDQWRLEYISLREETAGDFLAVGELPP